MCSLSILNVIVQYSRKIYNWSNVKKISPVGEGLEKKYYNTTDIRVT